jgi:hypothetical protein
VDSPAVRIAWLKLLLRVYRRRDRDGLYRELIAETERLLADAQRERAAGAAGSAR